MILYSFSIELDKVAGVGKNNYGVTRTGIHYPKKNFVIFKNKVLNQILKVKYENKIETINQECKLTLYYYPSDRRKRDATSILDAIFNILETARIIQDDSFIKEIEYKELRQPSEYTFHIILLKSI